MNHETLERMTSLRLRGMPQAFRTSIETRPERNDDHRPVRILVGYQ